MRKWAILIVLSLALHSEAAIRILEFKDESMFFFRPFFSNGVPVVNALLNQPEISLPAATHDFWMVFEDAGRSDNHRRDWMFRIWLVERGFSFFDQRRILSAVIFYEGIGEISIHWDRDGRLHIIKGKGINEIIYPWEFDSSRQFL